MNKYPRFDLEQQIMACWGVTDDIGDLLEAVCDRGLSEDELQNVLLGIKSLYHLKFEKLFNLFETCIKQGEM